MNLGQESIVCTGNWKDQVYPFLLPELSVGSSVPSIPFWPFSCGAGCVCLEEDRGAVPSTHRKAGVLGSEPGCRAPRDCADLATGCQGAVPPEADGPFGNVSLFLGN